MKKKGTSMVLVDSAGAGDIVSMAGLASPSIGHTVANAEVGHPFCGGGGLMITGVLFLFIRCLYTELFNCRAFFFCRFTPTHVEIVKADPDSMCLGYFGLPSNISV